MSSTKLTTPRQNWAISTESQSKGLYALALVDVSAIKYASDPRSQSSGTLGIDQLQFTEFVFSVNPKGISRDEPFAVTIIPTQNGQYIENQGQIYKTINISGTTGLRPNGSAVGFVPLLNIPNPFNSTTLDPETGLTPGERTGLDDLVSLANVFRTYSDLKRDPAQAANVIMVWQDGKDGEFFIVEPLNFKVARDAASPLTATYEIQLRTISKLDLKETVGSHDSYKTLNSNLNFFARIGDLTKQLKAVFTVLTSIEDRFIGIGQAVFTTVLAPLNVLLGGMTDIVVTGAGVLNIPRNSLSSVVDNCLALADSLDAYQNASNAYTQFGLMSLQAIASRTLRRAALYTCQVYQEDKLFQRAINSALVNKATAYNDPVTGTPRTGGHVTNPGTIRIGTGAGTAVVGVNDNIRILSQRLLGDQARWRELATLNKLKQPYISLAGDGRTVLRPGDQILYPRTSNTPTTAVSTVKGEALNDFYNVRLGTDIRVVASGDFGELQDFVVSNNGDLDIVYGLENMQQAINNRCATEQAELQTHPTYGLRFPIGNKAVFRQIADFKISGRASLLQDSRISDIPDMRITVSGNTLKLDANVKLIDISDSLNTSMIIRR